MNGPFREPAVADAIAEVEVPHILAASETTGDFGCRVRDPHMVATNGYCMQLRTDARRT